MPLYKMKIKKIKMSPPKAKTIHEYDTPALLATISRKGNLVYGIT